MQYRFTDGEWERILRLFAARQSLLSPVNRANTAALLASLDAGRTVTVPAEAERIIALLLTEADEPEPPEPERCMPAAPPEHPEEERTENGVAAIVEKLRLFMDAYRRTEPQHGRQGQLIRRRE